jgi:hypothetical protein
MFKSLSKKFFAFTYASNNSFSTAPQAGDLTLQIIILGNLFTWGSGLGLGYKDKNKPEIPKQVPEFDRNVVHVSVGPSHTAVITSIEKFIFLKFKPRANSGPSDPATMEC